MAEAAAQRDTGKKAWTDEERLELAAKLDSELEDYAASLEKRRYTEGWPEDRWQEEMEKHPFFMKTAPQPGDPVSPLVEGLQKLKYSEEDNTPEELAASYKEDGNYNYEHKNYRLAILSYTEGIKAECGDASLTARLYNNRAAAHFALKNYRSSLRDSERAVELDPSYRKAHRRAAECCSHTRDYRRCVELCDRYAESFGENERVSELRERAIAERKKAERDARMRESRARTREKEENRVIEAIRERGIKAERDRGLEPDEGYSEIESLVPPMPQLAQHRVRTDEAGRLIWPVTFLYPETLQTDFVQNFHEDASMADQLADLLEESPPEWDRERRYVLSNLSVYFEGPKKRSAHRVDALDSTLGSVLRHEKFVLRGGTPTFLVFVSSSAAEKRFLDAYPIT